mmetsp:Transcript_5963/g.6658  ORF Transcript_5963/g.6658 Transcript_5963/m.6658 type:complete len:169 (-) Transcript_5963:1522-2028(-)
MAVGYHTENDDLYHFMIILTGLNLFYNLIYGIFSKKTQFCILTLIFGALLYFLTTRHLSPELTGWISGTASVVTNLPVLIGQREILAEPKKNNPGWFPVIFGVSIPLVFILGAVAGKDIYQFLANVISFSLQLVFLFIWLWARGSITENTGITFLKTCYGITSKVKGD